MARAEPIIVEFPGFKYGVFERPEGRVDLSLYADIGSGEPASKLAPWSSPLADKPLFMLQEGTCL